MNLQKFAHICLFLNVILGVGSISIKICESDNFSGNGVVVLVVAWLIWVPVAFKKNWSLPLFGAFEYKGGSNQFYRCIGLALAVFMSAMLFVS
jgi:formate hydrogenlyase subunit 4